MRAVDTPLRRWRLSQKIGRQALAVILVVSVDTIASYEQGKRVPLGRRIATLMQLTGLPIEAFITPAPYLAAHPNYLPAYASDPPTRGRPRKAP